MIRNVSARLATGVVSALIGVLLLGTAGVTAANTRIVCFGTPGSDANCSGINNDGTLKSGVLVFSPVTTGGNTAVNVLIRNDGGQTLNHVKFAGGDTADALPFNPLFGHPGGTSLPSGATVPAIFPGGSCTFSAGHAGFLCDVGTLGAHKSATFTVVITPTTGGHVWLTSSWNEGWSTTGSNADYAFAEGDITVSAASCDTGTANYFLPSDPVSLPGVNCLGQQASIVAGALGGIGGFGSVGNDPTGTTTCPSALKNGCYGTTVSVTINGGQVVPGGVQWSITWYGIKSLTGVIHYHNDYSPSDPKTYDVIPLTKSFQCSAKLTTNCWQSVTASKGNANPLFITVVFVTPSNGKGGGFF